MKTILKGQFELKTTLSQQIFLKFLFFKEILIQLLLTNLNQTY